MEAYLRAYCWFEQDDWVGWLYMAEFAYNNSRQASIMMSPFKALLGYHLKCFLKTILTFDLNVGLQMRMQLH